MNENRKNQAMIKSTVRHGITFGSALAMVISYTKWNSIFWAIVHAMTGTWSGMCSERAMPIR